MDNKDDTARADETADQADASAYVPPMVEDIDTVSGPAETSAGLPISQVPPGSF